MPKWTRLHCVATYDNSKNNFSNPNPNATVRWGEQTWEEMMIGYFDMTVAGQDLIKNPPKPSARVRNDVAPIDPELARLAQHALDSQEAFAAFAAGVHKAFPKVDRVCLTSISDGQLLVERAAYAGDVSGHFAESGFHVPMRAAMLAGYALVNQFAVHNDLQKAQGLDLKQMSKTLGSSIHVPTALEGKPVQAHVGTRLVAITKANESTNTRYFYKSSC